MRGRKDTWSNWIANVHPCIAGLLKKLPFFELGLYTSEIMISLT